MVGINDNSVRKKLLQKRDLTVNEAIDMCRASEMATKQLKTMGVGLSDTESINQVKKEGYFDNTRPRPKPDMKECKFCGRKHEWSKEKCPAYGKSCSACGGRNNFQARCWAFQKEGKSVRKKVYSVDSAYRKDKSDSDSETETIMKVSYKPGKGKAIIAQLQVCSKVSCQVVKFQVDCGATVSVLPLQSAPKGITLSPMHLNARNVE